MSETWSPSTALCRDGRPVQSGQDGARPRLCVQQADQIACVLSAGEEPVLSTLHEVRFHVGNMGQ